MLKKILALLAMLYAVACFAAVDVNKATAAELDSVKGIGPAISTKIVDERKKNGNFKDWNDFISRVNGVGDKNAAKLSDNGLTVNGAAYSGASAKSDSKAAKSDAKAAKDEAKAKADTKAAKADATATKKEAAADAKATKKEAAADAKAAKAEAKADAAKPAASASKK
jgi:competence protein ComEA